MFGGEFGMAKGNIVLIPDVNGFCSSNLKMIGDVSNEAESVLPIFSGYASAKDFLEDVLGYSVNTHTEAAYLVPLNHARLDAVNGLLYGDEPLGLNATEKQIKDLVAALKTEKSDLEHYIEAELDAFSDGSLQESKEDLLSAIRAATAQQIQDVVPPHLYENYRDKLDDIAAYLDDGASPPSESGHVSLIKNEAGQANAHDLVYKGIPITVLTMGILALVLDKILGGASGLSKEVVSDPEVQYDVLPLATDTPDSPDQIVQDNNLPDWLIKEKGLFGGEKYVINREKLPLEGAGFKLIKGNYNNPDDGDMKPNDGVPEMMAGIDVVKGNVVVVIDKDFEEEYGEIILKLFDESNNRVHHFMSYAEIAPGIFCAEVPIEGHNKMGFVGKSMADDLEDLERIPIMGYERLLN